MLSRGNVKAEPNGPLRLPRTLSSSEIGLGTTSSALLFFFTLTGEKCNLLLTQKFVFLIQEAGGGEVVKCIFTKRREAEGV